MDEAGYKHLVAVFGEDLADGIRRVETLRRRRELEGVIRQALVERISLVQGQYVPSVALARMGDWERSTPKRERPACGARTRAGGTCRAKVVDGMARCRLHGGLSTGVRTPEGRARIAESNRRRARAAPKLTEVNGKTRAGA